MSEHARGNPGFDADLFGLLFDNVLKTVIGYCGIWLGGEKRRHFFLWRLRVCQVTADVIEQALDDKQGPLFFILAANAQQCDFFTMAGFKILNSQSGQLAGSSSPGPRARQPWYSCAVHANSFDRRNQAV